MVVLEVPEPSGGVATELDDPVSLSVFRWWSYHMRYERWGFEPQRGSRCPTRASLSSEDQKNAGFVLGTCEEKALEKRSDVDRRGQ